MNEICGDNRFEIIAKAKAHLLDATNIDTSEDEMKVLDNFLFRCWQMGWLDRYAEQTEPYIDIETGILHWCGWKYRRIYEDDSNSSEKPNNCEEQTDNCIGCSRCEGRFDCYDRDMPHAVHCNNYGKVTDEPQTIVIVKDHGRKQALEMIDLYHKLKTEPTEREGER